MGCLRCFAPGMIDQKDRRESFWIYEIQDAIDVIGQLLVLESIQSTGTVMLSQTVAWDCIRFANFRR